MAKNIKLVDQMKRKQQKQQFEKQKKKPTNVPWVEVEDSPKTNGKKRKPYQVNGLVNGLGKTGFNGRPNKKRKIEHEMPNGVYEARDAEEVSEPVAGPSNSLPRSPKVDSQTKVNGTAPAHFTKLPKIAKKQKNGPSLMINLQEQRRQLPIATGKDAIVREVQANDVTIIVGETGSGKTTQVPQYLLTSGLSGMGAVAVTQPRKVAAIELAKRVAQEHGSTVGDIVGYAVRFDEKHGPSTRIKYMTDGMIVREMLGDELLSKYSVVIVDEAHERSLRTDLLLANLKEVMKKRNGDAKGKGKSNPLKVVVMSATLEANKFSNFFPNSKVLYVKGRRHPVKIYHTSEPQSDYLQSAMRTFFQIHNDHPPGDVLIFLPGQEDIENLESSILLYAKKLPHDATQVLTCPMFAAQAPSKTAKVFQPAPPNTRKCILATNIAETSITIPGVRYVVDTGKCKEKRHLSSSSSGIDTLLTHDVTQSSALQRTGRAGREGPGFCFRLYTEKAFTEMQTTAIPEILRVNLMGSVLQLKAVGLDMEKVDLMDRPDASSIKAALINLLYLGAIDNRRELTVIGKQMASFPLEPLYARAVIAAKQYSCVSEVIDIVSVLSSTSKLFVDLTASSELRDKISEAQSVFRSMQGDHLRVLNVVRAYEDLLTNGSQSHDGQGIAKRGGGLTKKERKEWCRKHYINERALNEARDIRNQLRRHCEMLDPPIDWRVSNASVEGGVEKREESVVNALSHGLVMNTAMLQPDGTYLRPLGRMVVKIHPSSMLADKKVSAIIYDELIFTNNIYVRGVSAISRTFLGNLTTHTITPRTSEG